MERHPWLVKLTGSNGQGSPSKVINSPEKIQNENNLRTSLPHDGVLHNKSREYFEGK